MGGLAGQSAVLGLYPAKQKGAHGDPPVAAPLTSPTDRVRDLVAAAVIEFAKIFTIFDGTSEIQRMIIGRAVTGLDVR